MIDMVNQVRRLQQSPLFQDWKGKNAEAYLTHVFYMTDMEAQVGYYDPTRDKVVTFTMADVITQNPPQQVFKKTDDPVKPLDVESIQLSSIRVIESAREFQEKNFSGHSVIKEIIILQHLDEGQVYNVTFMTQAMSTLNMKFSAENGNLLSHQLKSVMDLGKKDEGGEQ